MVDRFEHSFNVLSSSHQVSYSTKNLRFAYQHSRVVLDKLAEGVNTLPFPDLIVLPLGVISKKEPNKFQLIHHFSFPWGLSINDGIDPKLSFLLGKLNIACKIMPNERVFVIGKSGR